MQSHEHILSLIRALQELNISNAKNVETILNTKSKPHGQAKRNGQTPGNDHGASPLNEQYILKQRFHLVNALLAHLHQKTEDDTQQTDEPPHRHKPPQIRPHHSPPDNSASGPRANGRHRSQPQLNPAAQAAAHSTDGTLHPPLKSKAVLIHDKESFKQELIGLILMSLRMCKKLNLSSDEVIAEALQCLEQENKT